MLDKAPNTVLLGDNLPALQALPSESVDLVYTDPPFNTGKLQRRDYLKTSEDAQGDRVGFQGKRFTSTRVSTGAFADKFDDYLGFLEPRLREVHRLLKKTGSLYFHIDYREAAYCKILLDQIFGRECFLNEIIWAFDYGARSKRRWSSKHNNILVFVKDPDAYYFDYDSMERVPYMAPGLVGPEKAARGKTVTSVWWHTIVSPTGKEKLGYPTQKPLGVVRRIVSVSCPPGGLVLDCFAGTGTAGAVALEQGKRFWMCDSSTHAYETMRRRFAGVQTIAWEPERSLSMGLDTHSPEL
jgi:site-specific DNA-methyltransferase (adenine-specific)